MSPFRDRMGNPFENSQEEGRPQRPSPFDFLTKLLIPGLALVALIVAQLQDQRTLSWVLLGFLIAALAIGFYQPLKGRLKFRINRWRDERRARRFFPELRKFSHRFREFVDTGRSDTLHYIALHELNRSNTSEFVKLGLPSVGLFNGFSYHFTTRIENQEVSLTGLLQSVLEFNHLISSYTTECVLLMFDRLPQDLRSALRPELKSSLNSFQQRFVRFLDDYEEFLRELGESLVTAPHGPHYFARPKPL